MPKDDAEYTYYVNNWMKRQLATTGCSHMHAVPFFCLDVEISRVRIVFNPPAGEMAGRLVLLALQAQGPELDAQNPWEKNATWKHELVIPWKSQGDPWGSLVSQGSLLDEFREGETLSQKGCGRYPRPLQSSGLTHAHTLMHPTEKLHFSILPL